MRPLRPLHFILLGGRPESRPSGSSFFVLGHFCRLSTTSSHHNLPLTHYSRRHEDESRNVRVSVWWDFENCHVPAGINAFRVAQNITTAIRANGMKGPVQINAFGDVQQISRPNQEALSATGIILTHVPNGAKGSADRALLMDLLSWVSRNPPPAHLFLVSGDSGFADILHRLRMNNYNILLASLDNAPGVLCSAASIMWRWNSMIRGEDLIGKLFNQPPDGPYGSWYGHYRGHLEDPFAVQEELPSVKNEGQITLESMPEFKPRPVPKQVLRAICRILKGHPKGILITELRDELKRKSLNLDKDLYGYRRFSKFLSSMPHILELEYKQYGQYLVRPVSVKLSEPSYSTRELSSGLTVGGGGEADQRPIPDIKVQNEEGSELKTDKVMSEAGIAAEANTEEVKEQISPDQNGVKFSEAADRAPPQQDSKCFEGVDEKANEEDMSSTKEKVETEHHVGFFRRIWRRWFRPADCDSSNMETENPDSSADRVGSQEKEEVANIVSKDVNLDHPESLPLPSKDMSVKEKVSDDSERTGFFHGTVSGRKFRVSDRESEPVIALFNKEAADEKVDSSTKDHISSQESFWSDVISFLESPQGSSIVSKSRNRAALVQNIRKGGPASLGPLSEPDLLHLVHVLISEKKLLEENTSLTYPFRLTKAVFPGSKGLSSFFSSKPSEQEGENKVHNNSLAGIPSPVRHKELIHRSKDEILSDVRKLVQEVMVQYPEGYNIACFKKLFLKKYEYRLDVQRLGYEKVSGLLQVIPGVSFESGQIVPSDRAKERPRPVTVNGVSKSVGSSDGESSDSWDELGPLAKGGSDARNKRPKYEPILLDEEEFTSGSEDETSLDGQGGRHKNQMHMDSSSLMQVLNNWHESKDSHMKAMKPEEDDGLQLSKRTLELFDQGPISFVKGDDGCSGMEGFMDRMDIGGEREKQVESILGSMKKTAGNRKIQQQM